MYHQVQKISLQKNKLELYHTVEKLAFTQGNPIISCIILSVKGSIPEALL